MGEHDDRGREPSGQEVPVRRFFVRMGVALAVFTLVAAVAVYARTVSLIDSGALDTARSYVNLVVATRSWNALHEGVWVEKQPGVTTNPYLSKLGIGADATTTDGRVLTLRNPAPMTREISEVLAGRAASRSA